MAFYNKQEDCAEIDPCDFICAHECNCEELDCPCEDCIDIPEGCTELKDYSISFGKAGTTITDFSVDGTNVLSGDFLLPGDYAALEAEIQSAFGVGEVLVSEDADGGVSVEVIGACSEITLVKGNRPTGATPPDPIFQLFAFANPQPTNVVPVEEPPQCPHILPEAPPIVRCD